MLPDDLRLLETVGTEVEIPSGQVLIERGQYGSGLFVVLEGAVAVEVPSDGTRELGPGAIVGERALLSEDGLRTARVLTTAPTRVLAVDRAAFEQLCAEDGGLADRLAAAAG